MESTVSYSIERLNAISASCYGDLTFPSYTHLLFDLYELSPTLAFGASINGEPVGLVLGQAASSGIPGDVLSLCVKALYRNNGVATTLLKTLEREFQSRGCQNATLTYASGKPQTAALERVLQKLHWSTPAPKKLICRANRSLLNAPWASYSLPSSFEIFPWVEILTEEREAILEKQKAEKWIPDELLPFKYEAGLEPINSLGVRYKGEVVGWCLTQRRDKNVICYCCSFMRMDLQRRGRLVPVYIEAIRRQDTLTDKPEGIWVVPYKHQAMVTFVKRRMGPYLTHIAEFLESSKTYPSQAYPAFADQPYLTASHISGELQS